MKIVSLLRCILAWWDFQTCYYNIYQATSRAVTIKVNISTLDPKGVKVTVSFLLWGNLSK